MGVGGLGPWGGGGWVGGERLGTGFTVSRLRSLKGGDRSRVSHDRPNSSTQIMANRDSLLPKLSAGTPRQIRGTFNPPWNEAAKCAP
jgi:hypothetical protein